MMTKILAALSAIGAVLGVIFGVTWLRKRLSRRGEIEFAERDWLRETHEAKEDEARARAAAQEKIDASQRKAHEVAAERARDTDDVFDLSDAAAAIDRRRADNERHRGR